MEISISDVNFIDDAPKNINPKRENIGNINDVKKPEDYENEEDKIEVVGEETEKGFTITFIDNSNSKKSLQNEPNNLHK